MQPRSLKRSRAPWKLYNRQKHFTDDPDENRVLECAVMGLPDYIVTGDRHLLGLADYRGIKVLRVRKFLDSIEREQTGYVAKSVVHISKAEAASDFASLIARVRSGAEVVIEDNARPVAVMRPAEPYVRPLSESLRLAREHGSRATLDEDFAKDVEAAIESHRESLNPPAGD